MATRSLTHFVWRLSFCVLTNVGAKVGEVQNFTDLGTDKPRVFSTEISDDSSSGLAVHSQSEFETSVHRLKTHGFIFPCERCMGFGFSSSLFCTNTLNSLGEAGMGELLFLRFTSAVSR